MTFSMVSDEQLNQLLEAAEKKTAKPSNLSATVTPVRSTNITDATMQLRWALIDPSHDRAATERTILSIEDTVAKAITRYEVALKAATLAIKSKEQARGERKAWMDHCYRLEQDIYKLQNQENELRVQLAAQDVMKESWQHNAAERGASW